MLVQLRRLCRVCHLYRSAKRAQTKPDTALPRPIEVGWLLLSLTSQRKKIWEELKCPAATNELKRAMGLEQIQNMFLAPALAFGAWNPFLATGLKGNAQTHEGFGTIASEWQVFAAHRLQEDIALMQRLMRCCSPDQILAAYTDFWHRAAEDYGKEIITMTKLMTGVTSKMVATSQADTNEAASTSQHPWQRAAA